MSRLRVTAVEVIPVDVPRKGKLELHRGRAPDVSPFTIVRIRTNEGVTGYGEGNTTVRGIYTAAVDHLADEVVGKDPFDLTGIHRAMDRVEMMKTERLSHWNPVRAAIDMALYDVQGRWLNVPLYDLLGGRQRDVVDAVKNISVGSPEETAAAAERLAADGYQVIKIRVGSDVELDVARVRAAREAVGPGPRFRLDANQAWDPTTAVAAIHRLAEYGLEAVEQPCRYWDLRAAAEVIGRVDVPIIADEGVNTLDDAQRLLAVRAADVLHVYLGKCGGLFPTMKMAAVAEAFGAAVTVGERVPLGISTAAHLHLAAALPDQRYPAALAYDLNEHDLLATPIAQGPRMAVPTGPGLGIEVDEDQLAFYRRT